MSALLAHAKAARIFAEALDHEADNALSSSGAADTLRHMGRAYASAAEKLEGLARAEVTGEPGSTWQPPPADDRRKTR